MQHLTDHMALCMRKDPRPAIRPIKHIVLRTAAFRREPTTEKVGFDPLCCCRQYSDAVLSESFYQCSA